MVAIQPVRQFPSEPPRAVNNLNEHKERSMAEIQSVQLPEQLPKFLTVPEVAALLRLSERTVYDMVSQRRIPFRKAGDRTLFDRDEILAWTKP
jgi:excisionase family DNA binding protein